MQGNFEELSKGLRENRERVLEQQRILDEQEAHRESELMRAQSIRHDASQKFDALAQKLLSQIRDGFFPNHVFTRFVHLNELKDWTAIEWSLREGVRGEVVKVILSERRDRNGHSSFTIGCEFTNWSRIQHYATADLNEASLTVVLTDVILGRNCNRNDLNDEHVPAPY